MYRGPGQRRSIALTFDDGPSEGTPQLLEYFDKERVKATFFQCGMNVRRLPRVAREIGQAGHEIGNHTFSHPLLLFKSNRFICAEFEKAQQIIKTETGVLPALARPPFGGRWIGMRAAQRKLSLLGVLWTVDGRDWQRPTAEISRFILARTSPGGIILLHDGRNLEANPDITPTLTAVRHIVAALKDRGYSFETVSQLLKR